MPIVFAVDGDSIATAVDHKPKSTTRLRRLVDIERDANVSVLTDHYEADWSRLWWVRADGIAEVSTEGDTFERAIDLLATKYAQYRERRPDGPVIVIQVERWSGWESSGE